MSLVDSVIGRLLRGQAEDSSMGDLDNNISISS
jgi:hypothetical protein